jgi:hypothetical protein
MARRAEADGDPRAVVVTEPLQAAAAADTARPQLRLPLPVAVMELHPEVVMEAHRPAASVRRRVSSRRADQ